MIELTQEQAKAMEQENSPLHVVNPRTQEVFVLIRQDIYKMTCNVIGGAKGQVWDETDDDLIRKPS